MILKTENLCSMWGWDYRGIIYFQIWFSDFQDVGLQDSWFQQYLPRSSTKFVFSVPKQFLERGGIKYTASFKKVEGGSFIWQITLRTISYTINGDHTQCRAY